jgi:serine/threonine-protein kinase HipA
MVAGESQNPGRKHLLKLANHFGLKEVEIIIDEVKTAIAEWSSIAKEYNISSEYIKKIQFKTADQPGEKQDIHIVIYFQWCS